MSTRIRTLTTKSLGMALLTLMLTLGASTQALARDHGGHRGHDGGYDRGRHSSQRYYRGHKHRHHRHYKHHRYGRPHHYYGKRHHYDYAYGAYGLGVLTGYLLNHQY